MNATVTRPHKVLTHDRQRLVLLLALAVGVVEVAGLLHILPRVDVGRISLSPSVVPAFAILVLVGARLLGRSGDVTASRAFWSAAGFGVLFGTVLLARSGHAIDAPAVIVASFNEELVYRFAVPAVVAVILLAVGAPLRWAQIGGFVVAGTWFVLLPGHLAQMDGLATTASFAGFAALAALVVYRSGSIIASGVVHTVVNLLTILSLGGQLTMIERGLAGACLMGLFAAAYGLPRLSSPAVVGPVTDPVAVDLRDDTVVDLRDGVIASVIDRDGVTVVPADDEVEAKPR